MTPYAPKLRRADGCLNSVYEQIQSSANAYYKGVETEIVKDEKGFLLSVLVDGKRIGGLKDLPDAMKFRG